MKYALALAAMASSALAKTDIDGCTSFTSMVTVRDEPGYGNTYASVIWYVPDSLEICQGVDCGGGRAPPKSVPGCPLYKGTETVTPEFLDSDPMKPTEAPESSVATATAPETSTQAEETEATTAVETATETETETVATPTASNTSSESGAVTTTATATATVTTPMTGTGQSEYTGSATDVDGAESTSDDGEGDDAATSTGTDEPGAAMPTAFVGLNIVAGVAAAAAFL